MPHEIVEKLNQEVNRALATDMREKLLSQGILLGGGSSGVPEDARTLIRMHLTDLDKQISTLLVGAPGVKLDDYSRAHLQDSQERIRKLLQAQVVTDSID